MNKKDKLDPKSPFAKLASVKEKLAKEEEARAGAKDGRGPHPKTTARAGAARGGGGPGGPSADGTSPAPPGRGPHQDQTEDERLAFHRMMSGVTPLDSPKGRVAKKDVPPSSAMAARATAEQARAAAAAEAEEVHARLRALVTGDRAFETHDDGRRVEGRRIDVPQPMLRKLRQGIFPIDARVDLHGLGASDARQAVETFVREKRAAGEKCLLIVHGKGEHSPRGQGVLRHEMAGWLAEGPASEHVAAFATATRDDGGEGAVYVLLRR
jgi:DNA-nicking Smr family endonuclease